MHAIKFPCIEVKDMIIDLEGQIERITYENEENGYTIARVRVHGRRDLVTVVGNLMAPAPGEIIRMNGEWTNHPKYGEQFKVIRYKSMVPASVYGIEKYLGSGLIKGIGPVMAKRIVGKFGKKTLDIIEDRIGELICVDGIGKMRIGMIKRAWEEQKEIREVMIFLQAHGISSGFATKIFRHYGHRSIPVVKENPYRLATDIFGIGFLTADRIAGKLGFSKDSELRAEAGIIYVLNQLADEGHVYYPYNLLIKICQDVLGIEAEIIVNALESINKNRMVVIEDWAQQSDVTTDRRAVYLAKYHLAEKGIASRMKILLNTPVLIRKIDINKAIEWVQGQLAINLAKKQQEAIRCAVENKVTIITGGPGTGKTTIISSILRIFLKLKANILLAAPTGRAAKRMSEITTYDAKTIHRMLEYSSRKGGFQRNEENPLKCDLLIVDETSMIDTILMYHLLKAIPAQAIVIFVGDVNQLPSVGAGNVLKDSIESNCVNVVELNEIFRQAKESLIVMNAHKINEGIIPSFRSLKNNNDFYFIEQENPEDVLKIIIELATERIPRRFDFDPLNDIQVLTPMNKGLVGSSNLNIELQNAFNPGENGVIRGNRKFRARDKVMQIRNNYDKDIFNGDIGKIINIDEETQELIISFDGTDVIFDYSDLDEIVLAYAVSVHKSQGSEYPAVIIPVVTQHYMLLQRNLIYTAVTRGKKLVVMVGTKKALAIGIKNDKIRKRYTRLGRRLTEL